MPSQSDCSEDLAHDAAFADYIVQPVYLAQSQRGLFRLTPSPVQLRHIGDRLDHTENSSFIVPDYAGVFDHRVGRTFFARGDSIALAYGTVMRNLLIALAVAINAFGEAGADAALVIALAYIIQVQSAAWYVRFSDRSFGKSVAPAGGKQEWDLRL